MTQPNKHYNNYNIPQMVEQPPYQHQAYNIMTQPNKHYNNIAMNPTVGQQPYHMKNYGANTTQININSLSNMK